MPTSSQVAPDDKSSTQWQESHPTTRVAPKDKGVGDMGKNTGKGGDDKGKDKGQFFDDTGIGKGKMK